jgi:hypothetical protein
MLVHSGLLSRLRRGGACLRTGGMIVLMGLRDLLPGRGRCGVPGWVLVRGDRRSYVAVLVFGWRLLGLMGLPINAQQEYRQYEWDVTIPECVCCDVLLSLIRAHRLLPLVPYQSK